MNTPVLSWVVFRDDFGGDIGVEAALGANWSCFLVLDLLEFSVSFFSPLIFVGFTGICEHLRQDDRTRDQ